MKILVIDNYDSFVYNLVHYLEMLTPAAVDVAKNDEITLEEVAEYDKIVLSPGPGIPKNAGLMPEIIKHFYKTKSILGVCLGHQALGEFFGFRLKQLDHPLHGISSTVQIYTSEGLFENMPATFKIGHYHSWVVEAHEPSEIKVTAQDNHGNVMAFQHKEYPVFGVQFHPESILTEYGLELLKNWLYYKPVYTYEQNG